MLKQVNCPICCASVTILMQSELRFGLKGDVRKCLGCGMVFLDQSSVSLPQDFYEGDYHQTYLTHVEPAALNPESYFKKMLKVTEPWAQRFAAHLNGTETVLDVGCSTGHFLHLIKGQAGSVYGHELNRKEIEFCRQNLGLDVSNIPLHERFAPESFDYISMIFVLEHIASPLEFLSELKKYLKPGGKFIIVVPHINDALVNLYDIPEFRRFYYCIEHLYYYSQESMNLLMEKAGLQGEVEIVQEYPLSNHLNWIYRRAPSDTLGARAGMPDVAVNPDNEPVMRAFWSKISDAYQSLLLDNGYGDRLWCEASID